MPVLLIVAAPGVIAVGVTGYYLLAVANILVPRHSGSDWLIPSQFRMGRSFGGTRIWMLLATPG